MRIPLSWLREMTPIADDADPVVLGRSLSDLGLVVEGIEQVGVGLHDVVVARVVEISPIAGADRIRSVLVDAGDRQVQIVCGAWNFETGDLVPLAPVGTVLPGGLRIAQKKMKGVVSDGMLCSGRELGVSHEADGLLVLGHHATEGAPAPGTSIVEALGIIPDVVFDLEISPNRPDCLSVAGVARDLAARLGLPFTLPQPVVEFSGPHASAFASVVVDAPELCTRLTGRVITGVTVGPSPTHVSQRLAMCGMRSVNSVVDASNYVMLELGQPTHPYDIDLLDGGGIVARAGRKNEEIVTLDELRRVVGETDCVIADVTGHAAGIGGIMGGHNCEISAGTTEVLLEAAHFEPLVIARTARRLGLRTEASVRFERGCDPEMVELASLRFCELVVSAANTSGLPAPTVAGGLLDAWPRPPVRKEIRLRTERVNSVLGTEIDDDTIRGYLEPIGFGVEPGEAGVAMVTVPLFRPDATREIDVIEEVARHHGYSRIAARNRRAPGVGALTEHQRRRRELRRVLAALGAHEAWSPSFVSDEDHSRAGMPGTEIKLTNPLASEGSVLRRSLIPGLLMAVAHNSSRRNPYLRLFEIGHVFSLPEGDDTLPGEREVVALLLARETDDAASASRAWGHAAEALGIRGVEIVDAVEAPIEGLHPTRSARLVSNGGSVVGHVGEIDPEVISAFGLPHSRIGWLAADCVQLLSLASEHKQVRELSRFPSAEIDLAFAVEESVPAARVEAALTAAAGELGEWVRLFDVYRGAGLDAGTRSLAFRLRLCAKDHTLNESEIAGVRSECITAVEEALPARLRG